MTVCALCGGDPDAEVLRSWSFTVPIEPTSQNRIGHNAGWARHDYRRLRQTWEKAMMVANFVPRASGPRRVILTRLMGYRKRAYDHANLVGGCKPVVDAMVRAGLLVDDSPRHLHAYYRQERDPNGAGALMIRIEEVAD